MYNTGYIKFKKLSDSRGFLTPIEASKEIPFDIKRIYYIYNVDKNVTRGLHAHKSLHQVLICMHGTVKVKIKTPMEEKTIELSDPSEGLYIGPMVWREMFDFSNEAVLLVIASGYYDESDYIRNYNSYLTEAAKLF